MSLLEAFRALPDGSMRQDRVQLKDVGNWIHRRFFGDSPSNKEQLRRKAMRKRIDLYRNRGMPHFERMLGDLYADKAVLEDRKRMLRYSDFQNVTRRIASELSTVYATETRRKVESRNDEYQRFLRATQFDQRMRRANLYTNLLNDTFVFLRSTQRGEETVPVIDVIPSAYFTPIAHPTDPTRLEGIVIDAHPDGLKVLDKDPHYWVYDDERIFALDRFGQFVDKSDRENPAGEIPGVLIHRELPDASLLDPDSGEDIVQAHMSVALLNTLMMRGQKTGTKAPYIRGDTTHMVRGQSLDSDKPTEVPEDTELSTIDLSHDPESLISSARSTIAQTAANYGIPEDVFNQAVRATSGYERDLKLIGLRQRRQDQILVFRDAERDLAEKAARVFPRLNVSERYRFDFDGWAIQFGDVTTQVDPKERADIRRNEWRMGMSSPQDAIMQDDPDIQDRAEAGAKIQENLREFSDYISMARKLNVGNSADAEEPGQTAQENGAEGGRTTSLRAIAEEVLGAAA